MLEIAFSEREEKKIFYDIKFDFTNDFSDTWFNVSIALLFDVNRKINQLICFLSIRQTPRECKYNVLSVLAAPFASNYWSSAELLMSWEPFWIKLGFGLVLESWLKCTFNKTICRNDRRLKITRFLFSLVAKISRTTVASDRQTIFFCTEFVLFLFLRGHFFLSWNECCADDFGIVLSYLRIR